MVTPTAWVHLIWAKSESARWIPLTFRTSSLYKSFNRLHSCLFARVVFQVCFIALTSIDAIHHLINVLCSMCFMTAIPNAEARLKHDVVVEAITAIYLCMSIAWSCSILFRGHCQPDGGKAGNSPAMTTTRSLKGDVVSYGMFAGFNVNRRICSGC